MTQVKQWAYRVETLGSTLRGIDDEKLEVILNEYGEEGWEVFSAEHLYGSSKIRLVAKKPLSSSARPRRTWPTY